MSTVARIVAGLLVAALVGCGQSGPLYLPGNPSEVQQPAAPASAPADSSATSPAAPGDAPPPPQDSEDDDEDDVRR